MSSSVVHLRRTVAILTVAFAAACGGSSTASPPALSALEVTGEREFDLAVGQSATTTSPATTIRFDTVTTDSRCPIDAICVWPGDAALQFTARIGQGAPQRIELHSFSEPKVFSAEGVTIELLHVSPATDSRAPIPLRDYRARLIVRGTR